MSVRWIVAFGLAMFLCSCASRPKPQEASPSRPAWECIDREVAVVAQKPVDLETATEAVLALCHTETTAIEREMTARYPGYRDYMAGRFAELRNLYRQGARSKIALARTR